MASPVHRLPPLQDSLAGSEVPALPPRAARLPHTPFLRCPPCTEDLKVPPAEKRPPALLQDHPSPPWG